MNKPNFSQNQPTFNHTDPKDWSLVQVRITGEYFQSCQDQRNQLKVERVGWECNIYEVCYGFTLRVLIRSEEDIDNRNRPRGKLITSYSIGELLWILDTIRFKSEYLILNNPSKIVNIKNLTRKKQFISRIIKDYVLKFGQPQFPAVFYMKGLILLPVLDSIPDKLCRIVMSDQMVMDLNQLKEANSGWSCLICKSNYNFSLPHYIDIRVRIMDQMGKYQYRVCKPRSRGRPRPSSISTFRPVELLWILDIIRLQEGICVPFYSENSIDISSCSLQKQRDLILHILSQYIPDRDISESSG